MPNTAKVNFSVTNLTQNVSTPAKGITFMAGPTELGPVANPETVIKSWAAFKKTFGGLVDGNNFPLICKRALDGGAQLRINRIVHYTDPSDQSTADGTEAVLADYGKLTFDADLVALNQIDITIDGEDMESVTFATDSDTTMEAIATALEAMDVIKDAWVVEATPKRVIKYTVSDATAPEPTVDSATVTLGASQANITDSYAADTITNITDEDLFTFVAKYQGAGYNAFRVKIEDASNGQAEYFNLSIYSTNDSSILEQYKNLTIPAGGQTVANSTYLDDVINNSKYVTVTYSDTTAVTGNLYPVRHDQQFDAGTDGTTPAVADYIGDSAGATGLYAFDAYDDAMQFMFPNLTGWDFHNSAAAYAAARGDIQYDAWGGDDDEASTAVTNRTSYPVQTKFCNIYYGLVQVIHPVTGAKVEISPMGDLAACISRSDLNYGEWWSYAGQTRGVLPGILKVVKNFGTPGKKDDLQTLAQNQINAIVQRNGNIFLSGNFTSQVVDDQEKFTNVARLIIYLQKALGPTLETFLEDPNDPVTWKRIYYTVKPFLDDLLSQRAYYGYSWEGDQDVVSVDDVQVNDPVDVSNGIYKVNLTVSPIPGLQEISVNIILTQGSGVEFTTA